MERRGGVCEDSRGPSRPRSPHRPRPRRHALTLRLELLQVARLAPNPLGESAALVRDFVLSRLNDDGGFANRAGASDLYYTVFGLDSLAALRADLAASAVLARVEPFARSFGDGEGLDFVHLACLARVRASFPAGTFGAAENAALAARIAAHRARDGGFALAPGAEVGSIYASFLGIGALQDLGEGTAAEGNALPASNPRLPEPETLARFVAARRTPGGGIANEPSPPVASAPTTAAAATLLRYFGAEVPAEIGDWLLARLHPKGGFLAVEGAPIPDLLSTAVALHALAGMERPFDAFKESCLDFVDTLWTNRGGFHGHWADEELDCEYVFYGLLALGHLSL